MDSTNTKHFPDTSPAIRTGQPAPTTIPSAFRHGYGRLGDHGRHSWARSWWHKGTGIMAAVQQSWKSATEWKTRGEWALSRYRSRLKLFDVLTGYRAFLWHFCSLKDGQVIVISNNDIDWGCECAPTCLLLCVYIKVYIKVSLTVHEGRAAIKVLVAYWAADLFPGWILTLQAVSCHFLPTPPGEVQQE